MKQEFKRWYDHDPVLLQLINILKGVGVAIAFTLIGLLIFSAIGSVPSGIFKS